MSSSKKFLLNALCCVILSFLSTNLQAQTVILNQGFGADTATTLAQQGRISEGSLDGGWFGTSGFGAQNTPTAWSVVGGALQNPTSVAPTGTDYTASESPAYNWFTNPEAGTSTNTLVTFSFDYDIGVGDSLSAHLWAVEGGGTPAAGASSWIGNNQGWINAMNGQNGSSSGSPTSTGGYTPYNLTDGDVLSFGADPGISPILTGTGTFTTTIDISTLTSAIPGVASVGDIDSFFVAFAADEQGGGTTSISNFTLSAVPEPSSALVLCCITGLACLKRRRR